MYATYNIHVHTNDLEFLQIFNSRQEAIDHLKRDAETHINKFHLIHARAETQGQWVTKKKHMNSLADGYYLKINHKHPNRISSYQKKTTVKRGYIFNSNVIEIAKIYIYGVIELPHEPIVRKLNLNSVSLKPIRNEMINNATKNIDEHINELKACLQNRRIRLASRDTDSYLGSLMD